MSIFSNDVFTCVACGCDDLHACTGGCSWAMTNTETMQGLCSACVECGRAALITVRYSRSGRPAFIAAAMYQARPVQTETWESARSAVTKTAHKIFGPGARVLEMSDQISLAIAPANFLILESESSSRPLRRRRLHTAAAARATSHTKTAAAATADG